MTFHFPSNMPCFSAEKERFWGYAVCLARTKAKPFVRSVFPSNLSMMLS